MCRGDAPVTKNRTALALNGSAAGSAIDGKPKQYRDELGRLKPCVNFEFSRYGWPGQPQRANIMKMETLLKLICTAAVLAAVFGPLLLFPSPAQAR
jgi:hypothetical protein